MSSPQRQYSTGLPFLDRRIDGGLESGCLLGITAPPQAQSHLLLRQLVQAQGSLYVSMLRPAREIREWAERGGTPASELSVVQTRPRALLDDLGSLEAQLMPESFVIIDRTNGLEETPREDYLDFLNGLKAVLDRTNSVGILHCSNTNPLPARRGLTLDRADQVWQLELVSLTREIKNRLLVTKSRKSRALREPIDIILTDRVRIDTSRTIA